MKKLLFLLLFFTIALDSIAQIKMKFNYNFSGKASNDRLLEVEIWDTNSETKGFQFIFRGYIWNDEIQLLYEVESQPIFQKVRGKSYSKLNMGKLDIQRNKIDLSKYNGNVSFSAELIQVNGADSVLAHAGKELIVENGYFLDMEGKPLPDPELTDSELNISSDNPFTLAELIDSFSIINKNDIPYCTQLEFLIKQGRDNLYKMKTEEICFPEGITQLSSIDKAKFSVIINKYNSRTSTEDIEIEWVEKKYNWVQKKRIKSYDHTNFTSSFTSYLNESIDFSFDYFEHSKCRFFYKPEGWWIHFDEKNKVKTIDKYEILNWSSLMGINHPYGYLLHRPDINGRISLKIFPSNNLSKDQWKAYLSYEAKVETSKIKTFEQEGLTIFALEKIKQKPIKEINSSYKFYQFIILDSNRAIEFTVGYFPDIKRPSFRNVVDIQKVLKHLKFNGIGLEFNFRENEDLSMLNIEKLANPRSPEEQKTNYNKYLNYLCSLEKDHMYNRFDKGDQGRKDIFAALDKRMEEETFIPCTKKMMKVVLSKDLNSKHYSTFICDSLGIKITCLAEDTKTKKSSFFKRDRLFILDKMGTVINSIPASAKNYTDLAPGEDSLIVNGEHFVIHPFPTELVYISKIFHSKLDSTLAKNLLEFNYGNEKSNPFEIKTFKKEEVLAYLPLYPRTGSRSYVFFIKIKENWYDVNVNNSAKEDLFYALNHLKIDGIETVFTFDENEKLLDFNIRKSY